jgi:hypothetical protein
MSDVVNINGLPSIIMPNPSFFSFGNGGGIKHGFNTELITIPVGSGLDPYVLSATYMIPAMAIPLATIVYVVTAPGGGATNFRLYLSPAGTQITNGAKTVTQGAKSNLFTFYEAQYNGFTAQDAAQKIEIRTDADVTVSNMVVRFGVYWEQYVDFTS